MVRQALTVAAAALVLALPAGAARDASGADTFRTPSRNVYCAYEHYSFAPFDLRCEIRSHLKPMPPKPASCREGAWGEGYSMRQTGPASVLCISDTIYDPKAKVLAYGTTRQFGVFTCSSSASGLRCTNGDGHGFFLSRERSYTFTQRPTGTFKTPSGNIVCGYVGSSIECGIHSGLRPPPPTVSCSAGDFTTKRVSLTATGRAVEVTCAGDPGPFLFESKAPVLGYGQTWSGGGITCSSETAGLTCRNRVGHGFFLSRERSRLF